MKATVVSTAEILATTGGRGGGRRVDVAQFAPYIDNLVAFVGTDKKVAFELEADDKASQIETGVYYALKDRGLDVEYALEWSRFHGNGQKDDKGKAIEPTHLWAKLVKKDAAYQKKAEARRTGAAKAVATRKSKKAK